ncbi:MAG TPA: plastocyanin/azurin family copper-binding protein [Longimicrobiaceae bacterium]|nr:plastocyanin/azurin family copper-binding protein [Longimicrobiaceae bacterium]
MSIFKRSFFVQAPVLGMLAFVAACGGAEAPAAEASSAAVPAAATVEAAAPAGVEGNVVEVKMISTPNGSGIFEPAEITVRKGDVLRFVTDGGSAHNVSFPAAENAGASNLPPASSYIMAAGQSVDVPVTMGAGSYTYQCDPHAMMGMKGKVNVTE